MPIEDFHVAVGFTRMINVMRAITALAAIETPTIVNRADAKNAPLRSAICLRVRDTLAGVFCYFSPSLK